VVVVFWLGRGSIRADIGGRLRGSLTAVGHCCLSTAKCARATLSSNFAAAAAAADLRRVLLRSNPAVVSKLLLTWDPSVTSTTIGLTST
jgi:hypothetical protein